MRRLVPLALVAVLLCLACGREPGAPSATSTLARLPETSATSGPGILGTPPEGTSGDIRPPADRAPVSMRDTRDVLANGDEVPFKVCSQREGWRKPSPQEMTQTFQDRRFGNGVAPYPQDYTYYLRAFYFPTPFATSANKYWTAFGGFAITGETTPPQTFCDAEALRTQGLFRVIRTLDYSVMDVKRLENTLVIVVAPDFQGWQETVFPYPPVQPEFRGDGIEVVRVLDVSGVELYEEATPINDVAWLQTVQYGIDGSLDYVVIGGILPYASAIIDVPEGEPPLRLYSSSPEVVDRAGSLVALDSAGDEAGRIDWSGHFEMWQPLGELSLPAGRYTLRFEDSASDWHHFVVMAANVPLPPGAAP